LTKRAKQAPEPAHDRPHQPLGLRVEMVPDEGDGALEGNPKPQAAGLQQQQPAMARTSDVSCPDWQLRVRKAGCRAIHCALVAKRKWSRGQRGGRNVPG
jgi:hypothetical protein